MKKTILAALAAAGALAITPALPLIAQSSGGGSLAEFQSSFGNGKFNSVYQTQVVRTERGFRVGNPEAQASLIEFISYTCSHCADFERQSQGAVDVYLLGTGEVNVEVRPVIRNTLDLTVSMLVQCGGPAEFKERHRLFLLSQGTWLSEASRASQGQQAIWARGDRAARVNMTTALGFDDMLRTRGVSLIQINACLADENAAQALIAASNADNQEFGILGTPSFAFNGELLPNVHTWDALHPIISDRVRP